MHKLRCEDYDFGGFGADTLRKMFARPQVSDVDAVWEAVNQMPEYEMPSPRFVGHFAIGHKGIVTSVGATSYIQATVYWRFDPSHAVHPACDEVRIFPVDAPCERFSHKTIRSHRELIGKPFPIDWEKMHFDLPAFSGVYILFQDETPVYCGQAINVPYRLCDHACKTNSKMHGLFNRIKVIQVASHEVRSIVEACLIFAIKPIHSRWLGNGGDRHASVIMEGSQYWWKGQ